MADLISLATYKKAEGIQATKDDVKLALLVESVSQLVKTYCNNTFVDYYNSGKTEIFDILYGENFVQLTESPVRVVRVGDDTTIPAVYQRNTPKSDYVQLVENEDFYIDEKTDSIYHTGTGFTSGYGAVKVVYKAGYASVPADLQLAVIDLITYYHKDEHKSRQTIAGASIQNQGSTSQRNNVAFPDHIKRVLDLYKNF